MSKKKSKEEIIAEFVTVHGSKYDYSGVEYIGANTPVLIKCPTHSTEFLQYVNHHKRGMVGCDGCSLGKRKETWIANYGVDNPRKAQEVLDKYKETCSQRYGVDHYSKTQQFGDQFKATMMERYGVESAVHLPEIQAKIKQTMLEKYGVENPQQNAAIHEKSIATFKRRTKTYVFKDGTSALVQGNEPKALAKLENAGYERADIALFRSEGKPSIKYVNEEGKLAYYFPDIFIPKENRIIEVKSQYTYDLHLEKNLLKQKACLDQGFLFEFWIL